MSVTGLSRRTFRRYSPPRKGGPAGADDLCVRKLSVLKPLSSQISPGPVVSSNAEQRSRQECRCGGYWRRRLSGLARLAVPSVASGGASIVNAQAQAYTRRMRRYRFAKRLLVSVLIASLGMGALGHFALGMPVAMEPGVEMQMQNGSAPHDCCDSFSEITTAAGDLCDEPCESCVHAPVAVTDAASLSPAFGAQYLTRRSLPHRDHHLSAPLRPPQASHS